MSVTKEQATRELETWLRDYAGSAVLQAITKANGTNVNAESIRSAARQVARMSPETVTEIVTRTLRGHANPSITQSTAIIANVTNAIVGASRTQTSRLGPDLRKHERDRIREYIRLQLAEDGVIVNTAEWRLGFMKGVKRITAVLRDFDLKEWRKKLTPVIAPPIDWAAISQVLKNSDKQRKKNRPWRSEMDEKLSSEFAQMIEEMGAKGMMDELTSWDYEASAAPIKYGRKTQIESHEYIVREPEQFTGEEYAEALQEAKKAAEEEEQKGMEEKREAFRQACSTCDQSWGYHYILKQAGRLIPRVSTKIEKAPSSRTA